MKRQLLFSLTKKDFELTWFSGKGGGGQHRNKHRNCCRIKHKDSGAISTGQSHKSRVQNQKEAVYGIIKKSKYKIWLNKKLIEIEHGMTIKELVCKEMKLKNLVIEIRDKNGKWKKWNE